MAVKKPLVIGSGGVPQQLQAGDTVSGASATVTQIEIDLGASGVKSKKFTVTDAGVSASSAIVLTQAGNAATGRFADENEMDILALRAIPGTGNFSLLVDVLTGRANGKFKINYLVG
jgi:hypothetical protein